MQKPYVINNEGEHVTLDVKHNEVLSKIMDEEDSLKDIQNEITETKKTLSKLTSLSEMLNAQEKIRKLKKSVRDIQKKRVEYHLSNANVVFDYFERKQTISSKENDNTIVLNNFFNIKDKSKFNYDTDERINRYLLNINEIESISYKCSPKDITCKNCDGVLVIYDSDGILVCTECSRITKYIIEHEKPSYKEPPKEACFYAYKRINHFREILAQFQAKESTQIPEKVFEDFKMQIKKERISLDRLTNKKAKEILKKLKHSKYYEHVPFIKDKIGIKPPIMDNALEDTLCNLFLEIQGPYAKYCPDYRVNFLNYYYTIYKLCELLEKKQFLEYFPMLKDKSKRIEQDNIWKNICKELNWRFIPTI